MTFSNRFSALIAACAMACAAPLAAETLRVPGYVPAQSDALIGMNAIAVEEFSGADGARLSFLVGDYLRQASVDGQPWITVLLAARSPEADATLTGYAEPRFSESEFQQKREICWTEDEDGNCIEEREVELDCIRLSITLQPELRLIGREGELLWASNMLESVQTSFCPEFDAVPDVDPLVDAMLPVLASQLRYELVPTQRALSVRIMESRSGLERDVRNQFRDAIKLTDSDQNAACREFSRLHADNPQHDSLTFNIGLCAERRGDYAQARAAYRQALVSDRSDDEATAGLRRIDATLLAISQIDAHLGQ